MANSTSAPPSPPRPPPPRPWTSWIVPVAILLGILWTRHLVSHEEIEPTIPYSDFYRLVAESKVASATMKGQTVYGVLRSPQKLNGKMQYAFTALVPAQGDDYLAVMRQKGVTLTIKSEEQPLVLQLLLAALPWIIVLFAWFWISRRAQGMLSKGPFAAITKGRTRLYEKESLVPVKFDDVAGLKSAKQDLAEIVEFLRDPKRVQKLGGKAPRGVLLVGPPGTGKTLLARAVAGEAGVPFFSITASEFIELFVGVGASRVRSLFEEAKKVAPSIVFIDEIDAVGRTRGTGFGGGHDEREQTLNQLLSEMDGFVQSELTIVLAATNRPDVLDPALLRPGRFDRRIVVDRPERFARRAIRTVHTRNKPLAPEVSLDTIANDTPGFSGADLANLVNEAALSATRRRADTIDTHDFNEAYDKIVLGDLREAVLDTDEKHRVAVHESGHALLAHFTEHAEPLERVSILPRGMALGVTHQTPPADKHIMTQPELSARLRTLMGGHAAELVVFGDPSSGAENDLKTATDLALKMVAHFGMSESLGPVYYEHRSEHPFLGHALAADTATSDATVQMIEEEARNLLVKAREDARRSVLEHRAQLDSLVSELIAHESIDRAGLLRLLGPARP
ncbi:MAG: ATP-dependent zinc metalloprotease FtsH [Polyangia bacterium]